MVRHFLSWLLVASLGMLVISQVDIAGDCAASDALKPAEVAPAYSDDLAESSPTAGLAGLAIDNPSAESKEAVKSSDETNGSLSPVPPEKRRRGEPTPAKPVLVKPAEATRPQEGEVSPGVSEESAQLEWVRQRYPSGGLMIEREVTEDLEGNIINHGIWRYFDEQGNLLAEGRCRDNQLHGDWVRTYLGNESRLFSESPYREFTAPFLSQATFEDGMLHGTWTIKDSQGRLVSEIHFADGDRHGMATWWYANGKKMQAIPFQNGFVNGKLQHWSPSGELVNEESYEAGRKVAMETDYYPAGEKKSEIGYLFPPLILETADDWWNAKLAVFGVQGKSEKHGRLVVWYPHGQQKAEVYYQHGQLSGKFTSWFENGQMSIEGTYREGKPQGDWTWWHVNGQKAVSGKYQDGATAGLWSWWQEDGRLKARSLKDHVEPSQVVGAAPADAIQTARHPTPDTTGPR